jgi:MFS family permease
MKNGFYVIMAAQFFSSLADNALLIAAIAMLVELQGPAWATPLLKFFFTISYVVLAFLVGAFADSMPKGRVMFVTNAVKVVGCLLILFNQFLGIGHLQAYWLVLFAYAVVGLGAAAYSPAKYGILTELLPAEKLVMANGWIEGLTVASIVLGNVLGGMLIGPRISHVLLSLDLPFVKTSIDTPPEAAVVVIAIVYGIGAALTLDEFALWLNLEDVYWARQGRESLDAIVLAGTVFLLILLSNPFLRAVRYELRALRHLRRAAQQPGD